MQNDAQQKVENRFKISDKIDDQQEAAKLLLAFTDAKILTCSNL
jgi:hypothetical protein